MRAPPDVAIALDQPGTGAALTLVDAVGPGATWYKVGSVPFVREGPPLVRELIGRGKRVFLDLKWNDIPHTVAGAVAAAADLGCALATVHVSGGAAMLEAAVRARAGTGLKLVGVGVLTSLAAAEYGAVVARTVTDVGDEQERMMRGALAIGLDGFVTAVREAARLRSVAGDGAFLVTPGIRRAGDGVGDHLRADTPAQAVRAGSDLLVIGRPITGARDPADAVRGIRREMAE